MYGRATCSMRALWDRYREVRGHVPQEIFEIRVSEIVRNALNS